MYNVRVPVSSLLDFLTKPCRVGRTVCTQVCGLRNPLPSAIQSTTGVDHRSGDKYTLECQGLGSQHGGTVALSPTHEEPCFLPCDGNIFLY
jgi:hypothetical protein